MNRARISSNAAAWLKSIQGPLLIACCYLYFLIFAQFAFLRLASLSGWVQQKPLMAAMGGSGLLSSLFLIWLLGRFKPRSLICAGYLLGALVAMLATFPVFLDRTQLNFFRLEPAISQARGSGNPLMLLLAIGIGLAIALQTVPLAASLGAWNNHKKVGLKTGIGTGLAYLLCNFPSLFQASPTTQAQVAALASCLGAGVLFLPLPQRKPIGAEPAPASPSHKINRYTQLKPKKSHLTFLGFVLVLTLLVWFDSAVFYLIQAKKSSSQALWGHNLQLWAVGIAHFAAAVIAGYFADKGKHPLLLIAAFVFLSVGASALHFTWTAKGFWIGPLYAIGVSLYSVVLVFIPSQTQNAGVGLNPASRAGLLYALAGWFGSAMGIGMAQDLGTVPPLFTLLVCLVLLGWALTKRFGWNGRVLPLGIALLSFAALSQVPLSEVKAKQAQQLGLQRLSAAAKRGQAIYIREGCLNCHSQYIRPGSTDGINWGPERPRASFMGAHPTQIGNRRMGPDLANVGLRRGREWQRFHLQNPSALSPGSVMPSYARLFKNQDGEDLLDYLDSLGSGWRQKRLAEIALWQPKASTTPLPLGEAAQLYSQSCAQCHGVRGQADGPLAASFTIPVRDLSKDRFVFTHEPGQERWLSLSQVIKFGIPGSQMPGHESYSDEEILGIARYVKLLRQSL